MFTMKLIDVKMKQVSCYISIVFLLFLHVGFLYVL